MALLIREFLNHVLHFLWLVMTPIILMIIVDLNISLSLLMQLPFCYKVNSK